MPTMVWFIGMNFNYFSNIETLNGCGYDWLMDKYKYVILLTSILLATVAQLMLKKGALTVGSMDKYSGLLEYFVKTFTNPYVFIGMVLFFASSLFWIAALSKVPLSTAFPFNSINFVLLPLLGILVFKESLSMVSFCGLGLIISGIMLFSRGFF